MDTKSTQEAEYRRCPIHGSEGAMTLAQADAHELVAHGGREVTIRTEVVA